jgi:hypothetical protein
MRRPVNSFPGSGPWIFSWVTGIFVDHRKQEDTQATSLNPAFGFGPNPAYYIDRGLAYTANLGEADSDGFDMSLQALITEQLRADVNVGYVDLRYVDNA